MSAERVFPFQKDAMRFASEAYSSLLLCNSDVVGQFKKKSLEIYQKGKISSAERILGALEGNLMWNNKTLKEEINTYIKDIKASTRKNYHSSKKKKKNIVTADTMIAQFEKLFIQGETDGAKELLENMNDHSIEREELMGITHLYLCEVNNNFVDHFNKGSKISVEFYTDKYLAAPSKYFRN